MPVEPKYSRWSIRVAAPDGTFRGQITTHRKFGIVRRFNAPSDWALVLDANDPVSVLLAQPQWGINASRTVYSQVTNQVLLSRDEIAGPATGVARAFGSQTLTVNGKDDLWWLVGRDAWPVTNYPFAADVTATTPKLWWRMDAASGTSEIDASGNSNTGTYTPAGTGTFTLNQPSLIDSTDASVLFNGSGTANGVALIQGAKTPATITGSYTVFIVAKQGTTGKICGSRTTGDFSFDMNIGANSVAIDVGNGAAWSALSVGGATTFPTAGPIVICVVVTATTWTIYVGGVQAFTGSYASITPILWDATHTLRVGYSGAAGDTYANGGLDEFIVWNSALSAGTIQQLSLEALSRFAKSAYDTITGPCETVLKHYVNLNAGPGALPERQVAGLSVETDAGLGATTYGNARFDKLLKSDGTGLLQLLALTSGMGFKTLRPGISGAVFKFRTYTPTDRSASVFFSSQLGNLLDYDYSINAPDPETGGNVQVVGGGGDLTGRAMSIQTDPTSISTWGRFEQFLDARDTSDVATMVQRGLTALVASGATTSFHSTTAPAQQMVYGIDYDLGDKVTAIIEAEVQQGAAAGPVNALSLFGNWNQATSTLATAESVQTTGGTGNTNTPANSLIGTATGYGELWAGANGNGNVGAWAAAGSLPAPTGHGFLYDVPSLEGLRMAGGMYQAWTRHSVSIGSIIADIYVRFSIRSAAGVYTTLAICVDPAQTIGGLANYAIPSTTVAASPVFNTGDKLYVDVWLNVTTNSTGNSGTVVSLRGLANAGQIGSSFASGAWDEFDTPGFQTYSPALPPVVFQDVIREIDITIEEGKEEVIQPILGTPNALLIRDALMRYLRRTQQTTSSLTRLQARK